MVWEMSCRNAHLKRCQTKKLKIQEITNYTFCVKSQEICKLSIKNASSIQIFLPKNATYRPKHIRKCYFICFYFYICTCIVWEIWLLLWESGKFSLSCIQEIWHRCMYVHQLALLLITLL